MRQVTKLIRFPVQRPSPKPQPERAGDEMGERLIAFLSADPRSRERAKVGSEPG